MKNIKQKWKLDRRTEDIRKLTEGNKNGGYKNIEGLEVHNNP